MREMRAISFVSGLIDDQTVKPSNLKRMLIHAISAEPVMREFSVMSKLHADWDFLLSLKETGRDYADKWIAAHFGHWGAIDSRYRRHLPIGRAPRIDRGGVDGAFLVPVRSIWIGTGVMAMGRELVRYAVDQLHPWAKPLASEFFAAIDKFLCPAEIVWRDIQRAGAARRGCPHRGGHGARHP